MESAGGELPILNAAAAPIGVFDSGVGGFSILRAIRREVPGESLIYLADQAHVPYGPRSLEQVRAFSDGITRFLLNKGVKIIVVACNTASAAALHYLREQFPQVPFVGMEPAVKPAAEYTQSGVVGVLATPATFQGALYASVIERFANDVTVLQSNCPGLVMEIDAGNLDAPRVREILEQALQPMLEEGIDTVVLGCTHFPFVIPLIEEIAGPEVRVIDPSPAIARQVKRLLGASRLLNPSSKSTKVKYLTTGDPERLVMLLPRLMGVVGEVNKVNWDGSHLRG